MNTFRLAMIGLLVAAAGVVGWRLARARLHHPSVPPAQTSAGQASTPQPQTPSPQTPSQNEPAPALSAKTSATESAQRLGPFSIAGRDFTVDLRTRKLRPGSTSSGDTVVAMEIRDAAGVGQYRRAFPYVEATEEELDGWSISAWLLTGTNGTGLLVNYDGFSEPSAPQEEPTSWFQVFGVLNGKLVPFGAPLEVQGGLVDENAKADTYKGARPLGTQADVVEFKAWTGHCRLIFPVRVDWTLGKLSPAQDCVNAAGELGPGCQYKVLPEDKLYNSGLTFVRLWPSPNEQSGQPMKAVVKKDSKVELLTALVATHWLDGNSASPANSLGPLDDAGSFGVTLRGAADAGPALWLKVRIDGKEGWMHSEEDFRALGLPEDE